MPNKAVSKNYQTLPETELAYFAGIVDGEGSISVSYQVNPKRPYGIMQIRLGVGNTNKVLIDWIHSNFGGKVFVEQRKPPQRVLYDWRCSNREAWTILQIVMPFLKLKHRQAEIVGELLALVLPPNQRANGIPVENQQLRLVLSNELRDLNSKGRNWHARHVA